MTPINTLSLFKIITIFKERLASLILLEQTQVFDRINHNLPPITLHLVALLIAGYTLNRIQVLSHNNIQHYYRVQNCYFRFIIASVLEQLKQSNRLTLSQCLFVHSYTFCYKFIILFYLYSVHLLHKFIAQI